MARARNTEYPGDPRPFRRRFDQSLTPWCAACLPAPRPPNEGCDLPQGFPHTHIARARIARTHMA
eukprot:4607705-Pyramimonas_sp.AAC.1